MDPALFIAKRIINSRKERPDAPSRETKEAIPKSPAQLIGTGPIIRIATGSVALGVAIMIIAIAIVSGFKSEIRDKVIGFGSHIQITNFDANSSFEPNPIETSQKFYPGIDSINGIKHIQVFATKAAIIKTENQIQGIVLKGIGSDFDWRYFKSKLTAGSTFDVSNDAKRNKILISKYLSSLLKIELGDNVFTYFIQDPPRMRKFEVGGIYETGLEEYDQLYALIDIGHIQKLNDWESNQVGGFEIIIDNFKDLDAIGDYVYYKVIGPDLFSQTIKEANPQIFDWLQLQDMNALIIIALMILVAGINMVSALLVLIIERTYMIGILKSVGASNGTIRKVFIYVATWLIGKGIIWGNLIAISFCLIQKHFGLIKLDQASYFVKEVPIQLDLMNIGLVNLATLTTCILMLVLPSVIVAKLRPVKSLRFS